MVYELVTTKCNYFVNNAFCYIQWKLGDNFIDTGNEILWSVWMPNVYKESLENECNLSGHDRGARLPGTYK
jgi:hypothetical protein